MSVFLYSGLNKTLTKGDRFFIFVAYNWTSLYSSPNILLTVAQDEEEEARILTRHQNSSRVDTWLTLECSRQQSHWLPWRPAAVEADEDCEDPHRLVLSDDFIDVLFYIQGTVSTGFYTC